MMSFAPMAWFGLIFTPVLIATGQILFKMTSARAAGFSARELMSLFSSPTLLSALMLYGLGTIIWIFTLKSVPLTLAYSFMALTFCLVPLFAAFFLGETVTARYAIGAALIIGGMIVINS